MAGSDVPFSEAETVTVMVASSVTVTVACVQELGKGREAPASFKDAAADSTTVEVKPSNVMATVE